ncbi:hypothetical protein QMK19_31475 [Streptomyces sp. H10-C2]|uniref:hypothetical protein n=1 Tax=unclassified Streptomyces TaxID=2593676 RepID=UPI0024BA752F|nr:MULTISPECIES: hypothetical protein [unclassified Streptomyces]MDJ0346090.1 hypothetical protein [Streptomyces sp. PH10-H1]MDJ0374041.1 hypothetical protein [Streptomyces sp. H10-C2]
MHDTTSPPGTAAAYTAPPTVLIETLLLRHDTAGGFAYRRRLVPLERHADPDHTARHLADLGNPADLDQLDERNDQHVVHSTSWRATDEGHIILTYLVHPDPQPSKPAVVLADPHTIARSDHPSRPQPTGLATDHVVAHAIRHLAFLARTDPVIAAHLTHHPHTHLALAALPGLQAGRLPATDSARTQEPEPTCPLERADHQAAP